ncbi:phage major capsid protein [Citricoccus sp. NR2]|uniref:phage major capsid protein n=1 Tax=Citricoccus sp. NR2 TaxID=3004095 RepID=UPI0022DD79BC|nr:phage major capsid protein [Citricoccus sp. NR2]WBL19207.1 phage major capsid protein [Citricoccus sp. NR2]
MSFLTSNTGADSILPAEFAALITDPVTAESVAFHPDVATTITTGSHEFHIPVLREDAGAEWVPEGGEITPDDPTLDEVTVTPAKVAGLTIVSRELAADSTPDAQNIVGASLARAIITQVDRAFLGALPAPAPRGLGSIDPQYLLAEGDNVHDALISAVSVAETNGSVVSAFLVNPSDANKLALFKDAANSNRPLLADARVIMGRPVIVNKHVPEGTIWAVDKTKIFSVLREGTTLAISDGPFFTSDRVAIRATLRIGFGFPQPLGLVRITQDPSDVTTP